MATFPTVGGRVATITTSPERHGVGSEPPAPPLRPWWRRRKVLIGAAALLLVLGGAGWVLGRYWLRERPGPKSMESARQQFRSTTSTVASAPAGVLRPRTGVYELSGEGEERIAFPPNSQADGATMPASVHYGATGCWTFRIDYNVAHWEEYDFCPAGKALLQSGNRNGQTWDFGIAKITNVSTLTCQSGTVQLPEDPQPGQVFRRECSGTNSAVTGPTVSSSTVTIIGTETITIAGAPVSTVHEVQQTSLGGKQKGSVKEDWWLERETGLPVRVDRHRSIDSPSPLGDINYSENGSWQMAGLDPQS